MPFRSDHEEDGFGLIEAIIAMVLLAVIAMSMVPLLISGIRYSSEQSSVATATRQLNALIDLARQQTKCEDLAAIASPQTFYDGRGAAFTTSGSVGPCSPETAASLSLSATQGTTTLATAKALVIVLPPAPTP